MLIIVDCMSKINEQLMEFDRAIELNPNDKKAYFRRGYLKATQLEDDWGALVDLNRAIEIDPNYADSYCNRDLLKTLILVDYNSVIVDCSKAIVSKICNN